jgi:glyoxylase-like metal-dependent hydrolase (beta-lactamase superfamily II)
MAHTHPAYGQLRQVTESAAVLLADNPGHMTLDGTNTWVLRAPGHRECVVVDPGPEDAEHLGRVAETGAVALVLVTHRHVDHTGGLRRFVELTGAPVRAVSPEFCSADAPELADGEVIFAAGIELVVHAAPGHTADSAAFSVTGPGRSAVLTGDTILGRGTTVLDGHDGDLGDYLDTLRRLEELGEGRVVLPGHGPELPDLAVVARQYRAHREERLEQVRQALRALGPTATARQVVEHVYADVDPMLWMAAEFSVRAQLAYLRGRANSS